MKIIKLNTDKGVTIQYHHRDTTFGKVLVAATEIGICYMGFYDDGVEELRTRFPGATIEARKTDIRFDTLHLKGTDFQIEVWQELLKIPFGQTTTYGAIARAVGRPKACRAVGTAVGSNHISIIIPCHRVIATGGGMGGYYWGLELKKRILNYEKNLSTNETTTNNSGYPATFFV